MRSSPRRRSSTCPSSTRPGSRTCSRPAKCALPSRRADLTGGCVVNKNMVGREGPRFDMVVERGKIREFARATGSSAAAYLDDAEPVSPPTFLTTVAFWQPDAADDLYRQLDIDLRRLLHGEQEFVFLREPPRAGAALHARSTVEEIYEKEGR